MLRGNSEVLSLLLVDREVMLGQPLSLLLTAWWKHGQDFTERVPLAVHLQAPGTSSWKCWAGKSLLWSGKHCRYLRCSELLY